MFFGHQLITLTEEMLCNENIKSKLKTSDNN